MKYITVDEDRYGGAYSGASYTAWIGDAPDDISEGDGICEEFWKNNIDYVYGTGGSPQNAILDLLGKTGIYLGGFDLIDLGDYNKDNIRIVVIYSDYLNKWWPDAPID